MSSLLKCITHPENYMVVKVKELQEIIIAMPVGKASAYVATTISAMNILSMLAKNDLFLCLCFIVVC